MTEESSESRAATATADGDDADDVERENGDPTGNGAEETVNYDGADGAETAETTETAAEEGADVPDLASQVEAYDADLAEEVADLESRLADAESELDAREERIDELESALKRSKADFKNYKKRAKRREEQIRERATEDFVSRIVSVRDNLVRALQQDEDADIRPGIESTVEEFDRILEDENVSEIDPETGSKVDPNRHEVLMRVDAEQPEGTVADVYRPGYEMAGSVLREAQVTVSEGTGDAGDGDDAETSDAGDGADAETTGAESATDDAASDGSQS